MKTRGTALVLAAMLTPLSSLAHAPYSIDKGSFVRGDGKRVTFSLNCSDGLLGPDPCILVVQLEDGTHLAQIEDSADHLEIRSEAGKAELFWYPTDWVPVAGKISEFDGYRLTEVASPDKRLLSLWVHLRAQAIRYVIMLAVLAAVGAGWRWLRTIPRRGWWLLVYAAAVTGLIALTGFYLLLVLASELSPPLLCGVYGLGWFGVRSLRNRAAATAAAQSTGVGSGVA